MSTLQERNIKLPDVWTKREQLCLASIVLNSSDQNWSTVGRSLKQLCSEEGRPQEWYSNKNCAQQYRNLLDNMDSNKRKKRSPEYSDVVIVDPATELLVKRLNEERMQELKERIRREQDEYAKLMNEVKALESNQLSDDQLLDMWKHLQKQEPHLMIKEEQKVLSDTTSVDMDIDDSLSPLKTALPPPIQQSGTSPLLSSLLKSPTTAMPPQSLATGSSARVTAPTITTLLTSGLIPNTNQPTITLKSHIPPEEAAHLLSRPISGPPVEGVSSANITAKTVLSPSQTAPTLSMLLEKSKSQQTTLSTSTSISKDSKTAEVTQENQKIVSIKKEESLQEDSAVNQTLKSKTPVMDMDDPDQNEEQQLLDVFENIGNLDELVADVAAVINEEGVDEVMESIIDAKSETEKDLIKIEQDFKLEELSDSGTENPVSQTKPSESKEVENLKVEASTSDDSNDNLPLSTVASLEKEHSFEKKEKIEENQTQELQSSLTAKTKVEEIETEIGDENDPPDSKTEVTSISVKLGSLNETAKEDVYALPDDDSDQFPIEELTLRPKKDLKKLESAGKYEKLNIPEELKEEESNHSDKEDEKDKMDFEKSEDSPIDVKPLPDSEDELSTKDSSRTSPKEDEIFNNPSKAESTKPALDCNNDLLKNDDDNFMGNTSQEALLSNTPVRPPAVRKLRDRDRSESPLVDDDTTTSDHSTSNARGRRRYSSTPNIDSIPNSPVNSITSSEHEERRETRGASKKSLLNVYNALQPHKHIGTFQRIFEDVNYPEICHRPIDWTSIKRNIESGSIKSIQELQRDILLMCTNAIMLSKTHSPNFNTVLAFMREVKTMKEFVISPPTIEVKETKPIINVTPPTTTVSKRGRKKASLN